MTITHAIIRYKDSKNINNIVLVKDIFETAKNKTPIKPKSEEDFKRNEFYYILYEDTSCTGCEKFKKYGVCLERYRGIIVSLHS